MIGAFTEIGPEQAVQFLDPSDSAGMGVPEIPDDTLPVVGLILMVPDIVQEHLFVSIQAHAGKIGPGREKAKRKTDIRMSFAQYA